LTLKEKRIKKIEKIEAFETYLNIQGYIDKKISDHITDITEKNPDMIFKDILINALQKTIADIERIK
jgi:hypothetical protein